MEDKRKMALYQNIKSVDANKFHLSLRCISQQWKLRGGKKNTIAREENCIACCADEYPESAC